MGEDTFDVGRDLETYEEMPLQTYAQKRALVARVVLVDPATRIPLDKQPSRTSMFDVHRAMTLDRLYAQAARFVGSANTVACSPVCTSQSPPTFTERLFEWKTLHESLTRIAAGLNDETLVSKEDILAHAYTPVISRHNIDR
jgi:hypothetical protein